MKDTGRPAVPLHVMEGIYALLVIAWYALPYLSPTLGAFDPRALPSALRFSPARSAGFVVCQALVYAAPAISALKIAAIFLARKAPVLFDPRWLLPILANILSSGSVVALVVTYVVAFATSPAFLAALPPATGIVALASLGYNAFFLQRLIASVNKRDAAYQEYLEFRKVDGRRARDMLSVVRHQGIQRRLMLSFVPLILVMILVLSFLLLQDFSRTITAAVYANGRGLAERTANVAKANPGDRDRIALEDFFNAEAQRNLPGQDQNGQFRFNTLSFYRRDPRAGGFVVWASTDSRRIGQRSPALPTALDGTLSRFDPATASYEFLAPVTLSNVFIGYVMVDYARDVIYEPFFRTQVKVTLIAALFMYASVFLIYLFGRAIVFPILFLRMSVNSFAKALAGMITGKLRISAELLQYKDRITTRDEIKLLSDEVKNMTTVIRGVIPYISASTLKHSHRDKPTTESKELAFLFTDIRGFTTLCERMAPRKVVELLNHYLDLQSSLILANDGDVDKFVGDEIMAMFDGPHKERNACKAGLEIRRAMVEEARKAAEASHSVISIGIGINSGQVIFGSVGARDRMDFTSIGDTVNLAARLEGANKTYGTGSLITETVHDRVKEHYLCREVDLLTVKGKELPVRIFEILNERRGATESQERLRETFEASLALYRKQKWDAAEQGFASLAQELKDETSEVFLRRIALFRMDPPPRRWDGVFNLTVK